VPIAGDANVYAYSTSPELSKCQPVAYTKEEREVYDYSLNAVLLANRTAARCMIGYWHDTVDRRPMSVCDEVQ